MDSLEDSGCWDFLDYSFIDPAPRRPPISFGQIKVLAQKLTFQVVLLPVKRTPGRGILSVTYEVMYSLVLKNGWGRTDSCHKAGTKACREKLRRERFNERFSDLSSVLEPGRPVKTDKPAILDDAIRVLNQLKTEAHELKETSEKLLEEIKCLKAEKNELREEKLVLKADKERIERKLKAFPISPAGFLPPPVAAYQAGMNKMAVYPNYGYIPMWQYLPPSATDTTHDHELRPPAA